MRNSTTSHSRNGLIVVVQLLLLFTSPVSVSGQASGDDVARVIPFLVFYADQANCVVAANRGVDVPLYQQGYIDEDAGETGIQFRFAEDRDFDPAISFAGVICGRGPAFEESIPPTVSTLSFSFEGVTAQTAG